MIKKVVLLYFGFYFIEAQRIKAEDKNTHFIEYFLENKKTADNYLYEDGPLSLSFLRCMTFGIPQLPLEIFRFFFNNTNFVFDDKELTDYGNLQKQRLYNFLKDLWEPSQGPKTMTDNLNEIYKKINGKKFNNIIRDIAVDYRVYGSKNKIFEENFRTLEDFINVFFFKKLIDPLRKDDTSSSAYSYLLQRYAALYGSNFKMNSELTKFIIDAINPSLHFLTSGGNTNNIRRKFNDSSFARSAENYKSIQQLIETIKQCQDPAVLKTVIEKKLQSMQDAETKNPFLNLIKTVNPNLQNIMFAQNPALKEHFEIYDALVKIVSTPAILNKESEKYKRYYMTLQMTRENGLFLPIDLLGKQYGGSLYSAIESMMNFFNDPIKRRLLNDTPCKEKTFQEFAEKHFSDSASYRADWVIIEEMQNSKSCQDIRRIRDKLFWEIGATDELKKNGLYLYNTLASHIRYTLEGLLEKKIEQMAVAAFLSLTNKTIKNIPAFPDEVLINNKDNDKFEKFIECAIARILSNKTIPHIIFEVPDMATQRLVKEILNNIFMNKGIYFYVKTIINPIALTKFLIQIKMKEKGVKNNSANLGRMTQAIFNNNVTNLKSLLEAYFIGENYNYLPWFSQVIMQSIWIINKMSRATFNINKIGKKTVTLLEIEFMESLCARRDQNTPYANCTLTYMESVNGMEKGVTIFSYTTNFGHIDSAVLSRIPFQVRLSSLNSFADYLTIVRRYLLELLKIENSLDLERRTLEEALWMLCRFLYSDNYDMDFVISCFRSLKSPSVEKPLRISDIITRIQNYNMQEGV